MMQRATGQTSFPMTRSPEETAEADEERLGNTLDRSNPHWRESTEHFLQRVVGAPANSLNSLGITRDQAPYAYALGDFLGGFVTTPTQIVQHASIVAHHPWGALMHLPSTAHDFYNSINVFDPDISGPDRFTRGLNLLSVLKGGEGASFHGLPKGFGVFERAPEEPVGIVPKPEPSPIDPAAEGSPEHQSEIVEPAHEQAGGYQNPAESSRPTPVSPHQAPRLVHVHETAPPNLASIKSRPWGPIMQGNQQIREIHLPYGSKWVKEKGLPQPIILDPHSRIPTIITPYEMIKPSEVNHLQEAFDAMRSDAELRPYSHLKLGSDPRIVSLEDVAHHMNRDWVDMTTAIADQSNTGLYDSPKSGIQFQMPGGVEGALHPENLGREAWGVRKHGNGTKLLESSRKSGGLLMIYSSAPETTLGSHGGIAAAHELLGAIVRGVPRDLIVDMYNRAIMHNRVAGAYPRAESITDVFDNLFDTTKPLIATTELVKRLMRQGAYDAQTPAWPEILENLREPRLKNYKSGDVIGFGRLDPNTFPGLHAEFGANPNKVFPVGLKGNFLGWFTGQANIRDLAPDTFNGRIYSHARRGLENRGGLINMWFDPSSFPR